MPYIPQLVLCTLILVAGVAGWTWGPVAPWALVLLLPLPHLIVLSGRNLGGAGSFRMGALVTTVGRFSGAFAFALLVLCCGWVQWLRESLGARLDLEGWPEANFIWVIFPYLIFEVLNIDAQSRASCAVGPGRLSWRGFHLRMFASTLIPPATYLTIAVLVGSNRWLRVQVEQVELVSAVVFVALIGGLAVYLPALFKASWRTHELPPGRLRTGFEEISKSVRFSSRKVLVWDTGQMMANAAIVGLLPSRRVVILSDALLSDLDEDELKAVYSHEVGHSHHHHVPVFLAWSVGVFLLADFALRAFDPTNAIAVLGIMGAFLAAWGLAFGWMSRRFELQADLFAMRVLGSGRPLVSALEKIEGTLRDKATWRHFGGLRRAHFLDECAQDPAGALRFEQKLKRVSQVGYAICVFGLVAELGLMAQGLPEDRTWAALGLGDYPSAQERVERIANPDPSLERMVKRTLDVEVAVGTSADSLARAWSRWQERDLKAAADWASMAYLQGNLKAYLIVEILEFLGGEEPLRESLNPARLPSPWRVELIVALSAARQ